MLDMAADLVAGRQKDVISKCRVGDESVVDVLLQW